MAALERSRLDAFRDGRRPSVDPAPDTFGGVVADHGSSFVGKTRALGPRVVGRASKLDLRVVLFQRVGSGLPVDMAERPARARIDGADVLGELLRVLREIVLANQRLAVDPLGDVVAGLA